MARMNQIQGRPPNLPQIWQVFVSVGYMNTIGSRIFFVRSL
jgi:hypothetical protein